jgi:hypothetical protein
MMDDDDDELGAIGGMIGKGNRSGRRKPASVPLCPPQVPHDLTWTRTRTPCGNPATKRLSYSTTTKSANRVRNLPLVNKKKG